LLGESGENRFTHTGATRDARYFYKVSAANVFGESEQSDAVLGEIKTPNAPKNVKAEALSESSIQISWEPVPGASHYVIYRDSSQLTTTAGLSYTNIGLSPNTQYSYQIAAVNVIGIGIKSTAVSVYTQPIPIKEGAWVTVNKSYYSSYSYYSFPADGGDYYIQWGNGKDNESAQDNKVSAYWSAANSIGNLSSEQRYFYDATSGYNTPQKISVPSSGYVIIRVYRYSSTYGLDNYALAIRYYR
jgi:chitodextrinase